MAWCGDGVICCCILTITGIMPSLLANVASVSTLATSRRVDTFSGYMAREVTPMAQRIPLGAFWPISLATPSVPTFAALGWLGIFGQRFFV